MRKVFLVYDAKKDLPDELRIFEGESDAADYLKELRAAGIKDPIVVKEPVEKSGKIKYEKLDPDDKPEPKKPEPRKPEPKKPGKITPKSLFSDEPEISPPVPPDTPEDKPEDCPDDNQIDNVINYEKDYQDEMIQRTPEEKNRDKLNDQAAKLPMFIRNPRVLDMVGRENHDLVDWDALDHDIKMGKNTYRANHIMDDLRMFDMA